MDWDDYAPDIKQYLLDTVYVDAQLYMRAGERYKNSKGQVFDVLENSPAGYEEVKVRTKCLNGTAILIISKSLVVM